MGSARHRACFGTRGEGFDSLIGASRRVGALLLALLGLLVLALAAPGGARAQSAESPYIVLYKSDVPSVTRETEDLERTEGFRSKLRYSRAVKGFSAQLTAQQVSALETDPQVASVTPDREVHALNAVPLASGEQVPPAGVRRIEASSGTTTREASTAGVAVIDTGIDLSKATNPDLNATTGKDCITPGGTAQDDHGHGTHVAGTIAAANNGSGVVGVAPGTQLYAVKVLDATGAGTQSSVICGIDWVAANAATANIKVVNMSLGGVGSPAKTCATTTDPEHVAICNAIKAGVTFVVAAGNDARAFDGATTSVPAAYPEVLTVTAVSDSDGRPGAAGGAPTCRTGETDDSQASFSNWASTSAGQAHTIAAPGVCITSTANGGGFAVMSGTSMATPHVAGSVALCIGDGQTAGPCAGLTPAQIVNRMRSDAAAHAAAVPGYGFSGDPGRPIAGRYYGSLVWDGTATDTGGGTTPPPATPVTTTASPTSATVQTGSLVSNTSFANLRAVDSAYYRVNSTRSGTRTTAWYGSFSGVPAAIASLQVKYRGSNTRTCSQTVQVWRFAGAGSWVTLDSRTVGTTEQAIAVNATGTLADYVSSGVLRVRVRCTSSGSFTANGNLLQVTYSA